jgi:hypothetical protein
MKRSEALNLIWEAINELEDANLILARLEKAGMMPPIIEEKSWLISGDNGEMTYAVHEWEPENE